ncbi:hypothetical protein AAHA92_30338 [Salvia divinorum]|uniref:Uncharacterized protein n=1 Tax=Salvia divinorum TaxID=28513 RepID=A0ABD1G3Y3_SALDI
MSLISYQCLVVVLLFVATCGSAAPAARMKVAVEGVVYCKVCIRNPNNSFHHEAIMAPQEGAVVKLQCNNTNKGPWELETKTDGNAHFLFKPERVSSWGAHKCRIFLVSSPRSDCIAPIGNPYFDDTPWKSGFVLIKTNTTSSLQFYTTARTLLYYSYFPDCI